MSERCQGFRNKLSAYADGELPAAEEERVRAHVAECADCRDALAAIALMDEAIATENVPRGEEDWEQLAARVDAAVASADELDRHAERTAHGWRRKKPGFFGGLLPIPVAFGSAGTLVAALLVVLMHGLLDERRVEPELLPPDEILAALPSRLAAEPDSEPDSASDGRNERLRALGYIDGNASAEQDRPAAREVTAPMTLSAAPDEGRMDPDEQAADKAGAMEEREAAAPKPDAAVPGGSSPNAEGAERRQKKEASTPESKADALRPVEKALRVSSPEPAPEEIAIAEDLAVSLESADNSEAPPESALAESSAELDSIAAVPAENPRTLHDLAKEYASRRLISPPPPPAPRDRASGSRTRPPSARPDPMARALEEQRRETDHALNLALAREVYLFAQERREEGDREGAIQALTLLLDNEHGRIREQAWADLLSLEGEDAIEAGEVVEIARVASASDAFLREYPSSRFRLGVIKRRVRLWAGAVEQRPDVYCEPARAAEAEWQSVIGTQSDPDGADAAARIRTACDR